MEAERGRLQANEGFCGESGLKEPQRGFAMIGFALEGYFLPHFLAVSPLVSVNVGTDFVYVFQHCGSLS